MIIGGFHLKEFNSKETEKTIDQLYNEGIKKVMPCHCTGDKQIKYFKEKFGNYYIQCGAGKIISL